MTGAAGGAMTRASIQRMRQLVPSAQFFVMYGQTEATARLTYLPPEHLAERLGSVGVPLEGIEIQVRNGQDKELPPGQVGELCARGPVTSPARSTFLTTFFHGRFAMPSMLFPLSPCACSSPPDNAQTSQPLPGLFDRVVTEIGYQSHLDDGSEEGRERWENVLELRRLAFEYAERGLVPFLENLALVSDQDTIPEQTEAPTLLTLHAAKGLEFTQVFIIGLDEGLLPHSRSLDDPEELAEERRLFYVGITRARDRLYLVRAEQRSSYGSFQDQIPSNFLRDIPDNLVQHQGQRRVQRRESMRIWNEPSSTGSRASTQLQQTPSRQPRYRINQRVRHPAWGEGLVVQSKIAEDGEETVDVFFESVGFKRLLASLANLEILS